ncbi:hypothetical protein [Pedobacter sp.]|uniref:hypothetical protein n=1 Tax=Pedobacter sp. TaxID=1411316 RepID=UPI003C4FE45F
MVNLVIDFDNPLEKQALHAIFKDLKGKQVIKIKKYSAGRSLQQNRYYWGCVLTYISEFTGHDPAYLHEVYKFRHIPHVKFIDEYALSTADMTKEEITDYIDLVKMDAKIRLGLVIPESDEVII